jgi:hypothetical protein
MLHTFFLAAILMAAAGETPTVSPVPTAQMQPGYGVVQKVVPVKLLAAASAAAGGSVRAYPAYRLTVRMSDGSLQYRDVDRPEFRPGEHVLLTNAGDVVADFAAGSTPPGESQGGAAPAEGAIKGGAIVPGERGGTPQLDPAQGPRGRSAAAGASAKTRQRCYELQGTLREQCLADEALKRRSAAPRAPTSAEPAPSRE